MQTICNRYLLDDGKVNPLAPAAAMKRLQHALLGHWLGQGFFLRDFPQAIWHMACLANMSFLFYPLNEAELQGIPKVVHKDYPLFQGEVVAKGAGALRFYGDDGILNSGWSSDAAGLNISHLLVDWLQRGLLLQEFGPAMFAIANELVYEIDVCFSMSGLGGCKTVAEFLSSRPSLEGVPT